MFRATFAILDTPYLPRPYSWFTHHGRFPLPRGVAGPEMLDKVSKVLLDPY